MIIIMTMMIDIMVQLSHQLRSANPLVISWKEVMKDQAPMVNPINETIILDLN